VVYETNKLSKMERALAGASAATLGYITAGVPGAVIAGKAADSFYQKRMAARTRPVASRRRKLPMKRRGRMKKRYIAGSTKTGTKRKRVTKKAFNKKVKAVLKRQMECDFNKGVLELNYQSIYTPKCDPGKQLVISGGTYNDGDPVPGETNPWAGGNSQWGFNPLSPERLLDAVSKLYNAKDINSRPSDNLGNFDCSKASANFIYASWKMTMTNLTEVKWDVICYKLTMKDQNNNVATTIFEEAIDRCSWVGAAASRTDYGMTPGQFKYFTDKYKMETEKFTLLPGGQKSFFEKWSGCIEFSRFKTTINDQQVVYRYAKGFKQYMFVMKPGINITYAIPDVVTPEYEGGCQAYHSTFNASKTHAIAFDVNEVYKVQQPDETADSLEGNKRAIYNVPLRVLTGSGQGVTSGVTTQFLSNPNIYKGENPLI